jgi:hypothetical protein
VDGQRRQLISAAPRNKNPGFEEADEGRASQGSLHAKTWMHDLGLADVDWLLGRTFRAEMNKAPAQLFGTKLPRLVACFSWALAAQASAPLESG